MSVAPQIAAPLSPSHTGVTTERTHVRPLYGVIYSFKGQDGEHPMAGVIALKGDYYGTTSDGGLKFRTVFEASTSGAVRVLYEFKGGKDGSYPYAGLIAVNGNLYGTTYYGGGGCDRRPPLDGCGTVFKLTPSGSGYTESVLHRFGGLKHKDGSYPTAGLIAVDGVLYGTTWTGGSGTGCGSSSSGPTGCGTVFEITTSGTERVLHNFAVGNPSSAPDGALPAAGLIAVKGRLYGTTYTGDGNYNTSHGPGNYEWGTVFDLEPSGSGYRVLYSFQGNPDGIGPEAGLIDVNGVLYGTTIFGGVYSKRCGYSLNCGTVFKLTPSGSGYKESVLYRFNAGKDGYAPVAGLVEMSGALYGTTESGGKGCPNYYGFKVVGCGTVFEVSTSGNESVLYRFKGPPDAMSPHAGLLDVNGTLYGTTSIGGVNTCGSTNCGTVFELTP